MRAFEVFVNGKKQCVAGVANNESFSVIASIASEGPFLDVSGSIGPDADFAKRIGLQKIEVGDEIRIRLLETSSVDEPVSITSPKRKPTSAR